MLDRRFPLPFRSEASGSFGSGAAYVLAAPFCCSPAFRVQSLHSTFGPLCALVPVNGPPFDGRIEALPSLNPLSYSGGQTRQDRSPCHLLKVKLQSDVRPESHPPQQIRDGDSLMESCDGSAGSQRCWSQLCRWRDLQNLQDSVPAASEGCGRSRVELFSPPQMLPNCADEAEHGGVI